MVFFFLTSHKSENVFSVSSFSNASIVGYNILELTIFLFSSLKILALRVHVSSAAETTDINFRVFLEGDLHPSCTSEAFVLIFFNWNGSQ